MRLKTPVLAAVLALSATNCAHAPPALVLTGDVLDGAGYTFEAVAAGMQSASDAHALTREQALGWNDFKRRWVAGYHLACADWRAARAKGDDGAAEQAAAAVTAMLGQLNAWAAVLAHGDKP